MCVCVCVYIYIYIMLFGQIIFICRQTAHIVFCADTKRVKQKKEVFVGY